MRRVAKLVIGASTLVGLGILGVEIRGHTVPMAMPTPPAEPATGVVSAIVDGSTVEVHVGDAVSRVRLQGLEIPTVSTADVPGDCLGAEAAAYLGSIVPIGTTLRFDYGQDRFGRDVAQASTSDGKSVNSEVAGAGFGQVVTQDDGTTSGPLQQAAQEAATGKRGLHSPDIACTVPGQVKKLTDMVSQVPATPPPGVHGADLVNLAGNATNTREAADELVWSFGQHRSDLTWSVLQPDERAQLAQAATVAHDRVAAAETTLRAAANLTLNQEATDAAAQAEAARVAKRLEAIRKAEEHQAMLAARRAKAAEEARQAALDAQRSRSDSSSSDRTDSSRSNSDRTDSSRSNSDKSRSKSDKSSSN